MTTRAREFRSAGRPTKGGHKFFRAVEAWTQAREFDCAPEYHSENLPGLWIADDSGRTPDDTDDGPLKIVEEAGLTIVEDDGRVSVSVEVYVERKNRTGAVWLTTVEADWLRQQTKPPMRVKIDDTSPRLQALALLLAAVQ